MSNSSLRKRAYSPYSTEQYCENYRKDAYQEERMIKYYRARDLSPAIKKSYRARDLSPAIKKSYRARDLSPAIKKFHRARDLSPAIKKSYRARDLSPAIKKSYRARDLSPAIKKSYSRSPERKYIQREKISHKITHTIRRSDRRSYTSYNSSQREHSPDSNKSNKYCIPKENSPHSFSDQSSGFSYRTDGSNSKEFHKLSKSHSNKVNSCTYENSTNPSIKCDSYHGFKTRKESSTSPNSVKYSECGLNIPSESTLETDIVSKKQQSDIPDANKETLIQQNLLPCSTSGIMIESNKNDKIREKSSQSFSSQKGKSDTNEILSDIDNGICVDSDTTKPQTNSLNKLRKINSSPENTGSGKCPYLQSSLGGALSSHINKEIEVVRATEKEDENSHNSKNRKQLDNVSFNGKYDSNHNVENDNKIIKNNKSSVKEFNNEKNTIAGETGETSVYKPLATKEDDSGSSLSSLHNKNSVNKQTSNSDSNSVDKISVDDINTTVGEEISEESRLIQINPSLREFDVLDEWKESEPEESEVQQSNSSDFESDIGEAVSLEDLDAMLEEGLPDKFKDSGKNKEHNIKLNRKVVLEEIGYDHFDFLPEGWISIIHSSGMPVYLHRKSRVCSMSKPYYLGPGSSRNHKIPLSAIPCLQYKRALEAEKKCKEEKEKKLSEQNQNQLDPQLMAAKIVTSEENEASQSLEALDLQEYCKKVFNFKTITQIHFRSWADRRKYDKMTKDLKKQERALLPGETKLLKFPNQYPDGTNSKSKGEWIINPNGKTYVCILHEYVQGAFRKNPKYEFKELENPATPYSATVFIGDLQYGVGVGASKKQAKVEAAKVALEVLIPEMKDKIEQDSQRSGIARRSQNSDISIFDQIKIEDPRVAEFCAKTTEPLPYAILLTCLSRNLGLGDIKVNYEMNSKKHKEDEFTMTVGNHTATVVCKNKRDGKQRAAQAILQALHPNITHWGSLLRMYGNGSIKNVKEKKQEEQEITGLQSKAEINKPNYAILEKLRTEMLKLKDKRDAIKAKGKLFTRLGDIILPSLSSTDLNKVNLI